MPDELRQYQKHLWAICFRMTGSAADADDLLQETFARALQSARRRGVPIKSWLSAIAVNLSRDWLRKRRRSRYEGSWLPSALETEDDLPAAVEAQLSDGSSTEGRYGLLESLTFAFLIALEALRPQQRAVLLLRDVFDYSVRETAACLEISEANVKTSHLRARRLMRDYETERCLPDPATQRRTQEAIAQLMGCFLSADVAGIEALLSKSVKARTDSGGEFLAARATVIGVDRVRKFYLGLIQMRGMPSTVEVRIINGLPAVVASYGQAGPREARRFVHAFRLDSAGKVLDAYLLLATRKLTHVRFADVAGTTP